MLITLGAKGMLYVPKDRKRKSISKSEASEVFDVSGAGRYCCCYMCTGACRETFC